MFKRSIPDYESSNNFFLLGAFYAPFYLIKTFKFNYTTVKLIFTSLGETASSLFDETSKAVVN